MIRPSPLFAALVLFGLVQLLPLSAVAGTISGTVTDGTSPVPQAVVQAWDLAGVLVASATADATGKYTLTTTAAEIRLLAFDPLGNYATSFYRNSDSYDTSLIIALGATQTLTIDFVLQRAGWIRGTVTDRLSGEPIAGAIVSAWNPSGTRRATTTTDSLGMYSLPVPQGDYRVSAWDAAGDYLAGFAHGQTNWEFAASVAVTSGTASTAQFQLSPKGRISGVISSAATQFVIPGAVVDLYSAEGDLVDRSVANERGEYTVRGATGNYRLVAWDPSGVHAASYYDRAEAFETSATLGLTEGQQVNSLNFRLATAGRIKGHVISSAGVATPAITVVALNPSGTIRTSTTTTDSGEWSLSVPPGDYVIAAWDEQMRVLPRFHGGDSFDTATALSVTAASANGPIYLSMDPAARVVGTVRSATTGAPIADATVALYRSDGTLAHETRTADDGRYITGAATGSYRLVAFDSSGRHGKRFHDGASTFEMADEINLQVGASDLLIDVVLPAARRRGVTRERGSNTSAFERRRAGATSGITR